MAEFTNDQQQALDIANADRRVRGLPDWNVGDFVRANPVRFPGVDADTATAKATPAPPAPLGSRRSAAAAQTALANENRDRAIKGLPALTIEEYRQLHPQPVGG